MKKSLLTLTSAALLALSSAGVVLHQRHGVAAADSNAATLDEQPARISVETLRAAMEGTIGHSAPRLPAKPLP